VDADVLRAALFAAAGETQAVVNQFGLASRAGPGARLAADGDFRAALRRALQLGRAETVSMQSGLGGHGVLGEPCDVVVAGRTRTPQLAVQISWHPRGEDHAGYVVDAMREMLKMGLAHAHRSVEQSAVVLAAPARFWRWLPGYAADHPGLDVLDPDPETPVSATVDFLAGSAWDGLFHSGMDTELPERLWSAVVASVPVASPWVDIEVRMLEVKGLGAVKPVR
jgi:hypothetical protein